MKKPWHEGFVEVEKWPRTNLTYKIVVYSSRLNRTDVCILSPPPFQYLTGWSGCGSSSEWLVWSELVGIHGNQRRSWHQYQLWQVLCQSSIIDLDNFQVTPIMIWTLGPDVHFNGILVQLSLVTLSHLSNGFSLDVHINKDFYQIWKAEPSLVEVLQRAK